MIRIVLCLCLLFIAETGICRNPLDSLSKRISQIEQISQKRTDSLQRELQYYKIKDDYYSDALSDQSNRFSLIIGGLLALAGLISWGVIKYEVVGLRKELDLSVDALGKLSEAILSKSDTNNRNANLSLAVLLGNMMTSSGIEGKHHKYMFECAYAIDLFSRNYKASKNDKDKEQDLSNIKALITNALRVIDLLGSDNLNSIDLHLHRSFKGLILSSLEAAAGNLNDEEARENLYLIKLSYKQFLDKYEK